MTHAIDASHHDADERDVFGFWVYILTDCVLFSCLFATYAVLYQNTYNGISIKDIVSLPYVFVETLILLGSSFTYGMSMLSLYKKDLKKVLLWLLITFMLGYAFVAMEIKEFVGLYHEGHTWQSSAAFSAFFSLVGTHGLHVGLGLIWMVVMMIQLFMFGLTPFMKRRLTYLGIFWAFLDIIWIFVFSIVYLMGAM